MMKVGLLRFLKWVQFSVYKYTKFHCEKSNRKIRKNWFSCGTIETTPCQLAKVWLRVQAPRRVVQRPRFVIVHKKWTLQEPLFTVFSLKFCIIMQTNSNWLNNFCHQTMHSEQISLIVSLNIKKRMAIMWTQLSLTTLLMFSWITSLIGTVSFEVYVIDESLLGHCLVWTGAWRNYRTISLWTRDR